MPTKSEIRPSWTTQGGDVLDLDALAAGDILPARPLTYLPVATTARRRRWPLALAAATGVAALAGVGAWGTGEHRSATAWRARATGTEGELARATLRIDGLRRDVAGTRAQLAGAQTDLSGARLDIASLAGERDDLADQRAQLTALLGDVPAVTAALSTCSTSMTDALVDALDVAQLLTEQGTADMAPLDLSIDRAVADCDAAESGASELEDTLSGLGL